MDRKHIQQVLVATNHLCWIGGSELYTYYLIKALSERKDIEVEYFTLEDGLISDKIENELKVRFKSRQDYDLILASHRTTVRKLYKNGPIVQICHGIFPEEEQPSPFADYHIGISEEVSRHLSFLEYPNQVIPNGIDTEHFKPENPVNPRLRSVLSLCQSEHANAVLRDICAKENLEFNCIDKNRNPRFDVSGDINKADLVVGIGRSVYDAMACGRPCVIYDNRHYNGNRGDGYLHPAKFPEFVKRNCSGRYLNKHFSEQELTDEIRKYNPDDGALLRSLALKNLNIDAVATQLLRSLERIRLDHRFKKWMRATRNRKQLNANIQYYS